MDKDPERLDCFYQSRGLILMVIVLLSALLVLVAVAVLVGPGFSHDAGQYLLAALASAVLLGVIGAFVWMYRKRPVALKVGPEGLDLPLVFKHPLAWSDIHRIRREVSSVSLHGKRDWLIVDPSPGVLSPLRLPVWRWLELKWQKYHGVRIPLHGLEEDADTIVASVERFRPVAQPDA